MEVLNMPFVGLFLAYVVIFCIGSWLNCRLATRWLQDVWPVLSAEFHCVGIPLRTTEELKTKQIAQPFRSGVLQAENYRSFRLYASGRRNCMCCLIDLDFRPRQDCLALSYSLLSEWRDLLFVDVPFIPGKVEPFVFSILRRKDLAFAKQTMHDVAAYTRPVPLELLPSGLLCMTDCSELVAHFLSPSIVKSLQALREYIELIHISDENTISCFGPNQVHREAMRFRLRMPRSAQDRRALLSLVFSFEGREQVQQQQQHEGLFVWVVGSTTNVYETGKLVNLLPDGKFEVAMVESGETRSIARRLLFPASEKDPLETSDLTQLDFINEANLLWALQKRTEADLPYSFIGPVLVAVNPLIAIPDPEGVEAGATRMPHVPHPYTLAERMLLQLELSQLQGHPRSQSVIISGESGSGKTVTAKMVLQHSIHSDCPLDERLLQANPILEAFGNASTLRNDNSSRFGKFFKLFFDEDGNVDGATLETYLLERSRVTRHVHGERNFHIFYALLAGDASHMGVDEAFREKLGLVDRDFNYAKMRNGARPARLLAKDMETLEHVMRAFSSIGIADDASERILETLAGLLHLGNLVFIDEGSTYDGEQAELIADSDALVHLCALWGLASHAEASRLLCERTINVGRETTRVPLSVEQAQKARDAVAKDVYARLFQWICARVNQSLEGLASVASFADMPFVGVLDIFGFESFEQNGLEQLLINYANERLQASFNMHVLQDEADLYMREGLVSAGSYSRARGFSESPRRGLRAGSNSPAVPRVSAAASDVIEEVLELLDEEAQRLDGSDLGLNRRIQDQLASNKSLRTPHPSRRAEQFIIAHTAGHVTYTVGTFLERNDDVLPKETLDVLRRVDNQVLAEAFTDARSHAHARSSKSRHKTGARNAGKQLSVSGKFVCQIEDLVESLDATSCSYVRCIKPNPIMRRDDPEKDIPTSTAKKRSSGKETKSADDATPSFPWFDRRYVSAQIKSLCLPQAALTLRDGLPVRLQLDELMSILDPAIQGPVERACHSHGLGRMTRFLPVMLGAFGVESSAYRLGATQVFFHNDQVDQLQTALRRIDNWVGDDSQFADDGDYLQLYRGAKGRERALDRIAEVEANEALLEEAAIADQEMSSDLEDENDGPRVNAGSTGGNSLHSQSQPRGSFHSRSQFKFEGTRKGTSIGRTPPFNSTGFAQKRTADRRISRCARCHC
ncbi:Unconventional myosin-Va [Hondaea fermentalgiana]|uniref:Unconventional myosin-Va n=1 Tax=Hondaea fermentalgiana TaxID=2315210 RepID=A0A2R5GHD1_9STRA|nr:Unconventional myosin-Va [Hondaea fermentalgiana]|eukprot:GBG30327.1 Unconventional myosin-Va [Hondaea fermentalgiana]